MIYHMNGKFDILDLLFQYQLFLAVSIPAHLEHEPVVVRQEQLVLNHSVLFKLGLGVEFGYLGRDFSGVFEEAVLEHLDISAPAAARLGLSFPLHRRGQYSRSRSNLSSGQCAAYNRFRGES